MLTLFVVWLYMKNVAANTPLKDAEQAAHVWGRNLSYTRGETRAGIS